METCDKSASPLLGADVKRYASGMEDSSRTSSPTHDRTVRPGARTRQTKTREVLLSAARRMMARRSRATFTIDELIQAAGVAKGSFYNHFPDKEAIADEVHRVVREVEEAEVRAVNSDVQDPVARIARGMAVYARMSLTVPEDARILTLHQFDGHFLQSAVNAGLVADLRAALGKGRVVAPSIEAAAMLVVGQVAVLMARLSGESSNTTAHAVAQHCIAITLVGIGLSHRDAQLIATQAVEAILQVP